MGDDGGETCLREAFRRRLTAIHLERIGRCMRMARDAFDVERVKGRPGEAGRYVTTRLDGCGELRDEFVPLFNRFRDRERNPYAIHHQGGGDPHARRCDAFSVWREETTDPS